MDSAVRPNPAPGLVALALVLPPPVAAQGFGTPARLAEVEVDRSRSCVTVLQSLDSLDTAMEPLARRSRRLQDIAQAVALEERSIVDSLDTADPLETRVREWFATDAALAQRFLNQQDPSIQAERTAGRETIKAAVSRALQEVQEEASTAMEENQDLLAAAAPCDGAIFVRSAVLEACEDGRGAICEQAARPASEVSGFRFVDEPASIWEVEEMRPWSTPTPLRAGPTGLDGARTVGFTRVGNVVASVAFSPLFIPEEQVPPETLAAYEATNDTLGLSLDHPTIAFTPALALRLAIPRPLDREESYILHFGTPDQAEVVWSGPAGTGAPIEGTVPLTPGQVRRLVAGDQLTVTALAPGDPLEAVWAVGISGANQARATQALLAYMSDRLERDLARIAPPSGE